MIYWRHIPFARVFFITLIVYQVTKKAGIYILENIRNFSKNQIQNGETLPKLNWHLFKIWPVSLIWHNHVWFYSYHKVFNPYFELHIQNDPRKCFFFSLSFWDRAKTFAIFSKDQKLFQLLGVGLIAIYKSLTWLAIFYTTFFNGLHGRERLLCCVFRIVFVLFLLGFWWRRRHHWWRL